MDKVVIQVSQGRGVTQTILGVISLLVANFLWRMSAKNYEN